MMNTAAKKIYGIIYSLCNVTTIYKSELFDSQRYEGGKKLNVDSRLLKAFHYVLIGARKQMWPGPSFDPVYYKGHVGDLEAWGNNPLLHYIKEGMAQDVKILPKFYELYKEHSCEIKRRNFFDEVYYREQINNYDNNLNCLLHYFMTGCKCGLRPARDFDPSYYARQVGGLSDWDLNPLVHYIVQGEKKGLRTRSIEEELYYSNEAALTESGLFDIEFYREQINNYDPSVNCLLHYFTVGVQHDLRPNRQFDPNYYRRQVGDLSHWGNNPLLHYVLIGKSQGMALLTNEETLLHKHADAIRKSGFFDEEYYREQVNCYSPAFNALEHYIVYGEKHGLKPCKSFDPNVYKTTYQDVHDSGLTPLIHYVLIGVHEGRRTSFELEVELIDNSAKEYVPGSKTRFYEEKRTVSGESRIDCFAYYLPQFHPIPENDKWWGEGLTEWVNVTKATPLWHGHIQPNLPSDLGYYDLRLPETLNRQAEMAINYGLKGFCFYYYWFAGKRLLEKPIDIFVENKNISASFFFCWANENWSRRWDGKENEILISQKHSEEDDIAIINDLCRYFRDDRYYRIDGKPLVVIYRVDILPDPEGMIKRWRSECISNGIGEILVAAALTFDTKDVSGYGFDLVIEFPPHNISNLQKANNRVDGLVKKFSGNIYTYSSYVSSVFEDVHNANDVPIVRTVMPSWDNTARRGARATVFCDAIPDYFQNAAEAKVEQQLKDGRSPKMLMVNAWNEWAEGAALEPSQAYGYAYLNRLKRSLCRKKLGRIAYLSNELLHDQQEIMSMLEQDATSTIIEGNGEDPWMYMLHNAEEILENDIVVLRMDARVSTLSIARYLKDLNGIFDCGAFALQKIAQCQVYDRASGFIHELASYLNISLEFELPFEDAAYSTYIFRVSALGYVLRSSSLILSIISDDTDRQELFRRILPSLIIANQFRYEYIDEL